MNEKNKKILKKFSIKAGAASLAVLKCISEGFLTWADDTINRRTLSQCLRRAENMKRFPDYYKEYTDILKGIKSGNLDTILCRLQKKGLVEKKKDGYKTTKLGLKFLSQKEISKKSSLWDGKYRIFIFDIPENLHSLRDWLRSQIVLLNYKALQKSVFIGKHPIPENLFKEIIDRGLDKYIRLMTVGEIDDENILKQL